MIDNKINIVGTKYNKLTITEDLGVTKRKRHCMAICDCGVIKRYEVSCLKSNNTKSCGCLRIESNSKGHNTKHKLGGHPLYGVWSSMRDRCKCITDKAYPNYGGSGVKICKEWDEFKPFYDWALKNGWQKGLQLDKDKLSPFKTGIIYSPEYCCFLTRKENMRYRRNSILITYDNNVKSLPEWCDILGLNHKLIMGRLHHGWEVKRAFETIVNKKNFSRKDILKTKAA